MMTQSFSHMPVKLVVAPAGMAVTKIGTPSFQEAIHIADQLIDRYEIPLPVRELTNSLASPDQRLGCGSYAEITTVTTESVAVVSERKTQEVQALTRLMQLDDARFLAVNGELKSPFQQSFDPPDQLPRLIARQNHESSSPGEFHPQALTEPDGSLSTHPALIIRPTAASPRKVHPHRWVDPTTKLDDLAPSLDAHYRHFFATTSQSAPVPRIGTLVLVGLPLGLLP